MRKVLENTPNLHIREGMATRVMMSSNDEAEGIETYFGMHFAAKAVVLTTGTFMNGTIWVGRKAMPAGRYALWPSICPTPPVRQVGPEAHDQALTPPQHDRILILLHAPPTLAVNSAPALCARAAASRCSVSSRRPISADAAVLCCGADHTQAPAGPHLHTRVDHACVHIALESQRWCARPAHWQTTRRAAPLHMGSTCRTLHPSFQICFFPTAPAAAPENGAALPRQRTCL